MAIIKAFKGLRPPKALAQNVAARPYDVLNSAEARKEVEGNPHSFLHVTKPEVDLSVGTDLYSGEVYAKGKSNLERFESEGTLVEDAEPKIYIYRQIWKSVEQYGLVVCSAIDDYFNDVIKKHEYTRPAKEEDRIKHMDTLSAHVGPVFITYPQVDDIDAIVADYVASHAAEYDFELGDDVTHTLWVVGDTDVIEKLEGLFAAKVPATYIADGHHRAASSAKVGERRRKANAAHNGTEDYNFFLSVLFPDNQLKIIDYNRVVKDLNGHTELFFREQVEENFTLEAIENGPFHPASLHEFGMYLDGTWYKLNAKDGVYSDDPIGILDITILSELVLDPLLGIKDQRTDERVDFVGGIRGLKELERRVDSGEMKIAFSLYPVSIEQLISIADSGHVMPPKSTWFEPKLRSGLVSHKF